MHVCLHARKHTHAHKIMRKQGITLGFISWIEKERNHVLDNLEIFKVMRSNESVRNGKMGKVKEMEEGKGVGSGIGM